MSSKNYPVSVTDSYFSTFSYTFDKDGYPTEIVSTGTGNLTEKRVYTYQ